MFFFRPQLGKKNILSKHVKLATNKKFLRTNIGIDFRFIALPKLRGQEDVRLMRKVKFKYSRLHLSWHGQDNQLGHVDELSSVAKDETSCAEDHSSPKHQKEKRLGVVFV